MCPCKVGHTFRLQYTLLFLVCGKLPREKLWSSLTFSFHPHDSWTFLLLLLSFTSVLCCYSRLPGAPFTLPNHCILCSFDPPGSGTSLLVDAYLFAKEEAISLDVFCCPSHSLLKENNTQTKNNSKRNIIH